MKQVYFLFKVGNIKESLDYLDKAKLLLVNSKQKRSWKKLEKLLKIVKDSKII